MDETPTPWFDSPSIVDDTTTVGCMCVDSCTVVFEGTSDSPVRLQPKCNSTVGDFLIAHEKLVGKMVVESITMNGREIHPPHVMEVGQVIVVKLIEEEALQAVCATDIDTPVMVSPTAKWPGPVECDALPSPPRKISKYDVGECKIPKPENVSETAWLDATPLLGLQGEQFLRLPMPSLTTTQQLWAVRHQFLQTPDRMNVLDKQLRLMADDEIRFHLVRLAESHNAANTAKPVQVLDPLLVSAWVNGKGFDCSLWAKDHQGIRDSKFTMISAVLVDQHWIPVYLNPVQDILHVYTWGELAADHAHLNNIFTKLASAWGFVDALICKEQRLFFTTDLCGALAVSFLRSTLGGTQLPSNTSEAEQVHDKLRAQFKDAIQQCQISHRPWIWGAGDHDDPDRVRSIHPGHSPVAMRDALLVDRDTRIDLINQNEPAMGDDEVRFHLVQLIDKQPRGASGQTRFTFLEPLIFSCWDTVGQTIASQWCTRNPQVLEHGQQIVSAVALENHWLPIWFVPDGTSIQIHTLHEEGIDMEGLEHKLITVASELGFRNFAVHKIPKGIETPRHCGAYAMSFLAHIIMSSPLPEDAHELHTFHTNMRASFVEYLYSVQSTPTPVTWGNGPPGESGRLPIMPDDTSETEADKASLPFCCLGESTLTVRDPICFEYCLCTAQGYEAVTEADQQAMAKHQRTLLLSRHGHAMGDDEILFHLQHLSDCHAQRPASSQRAPRLFKAIPPTLLHDLMYYDGNDLQTWNDTHPDCKQKHLVTVLWVQDHWFPLWISPQTNTIHCHTFHSADDSKVDMAMTCLASRLGYESRVVHRVPNPQASSGLCGPMAICLLAHVMLGTVLPRNDGELRHRSWRMKEIFAECLGDNPNLPTIWGWGLVGNMTQAPVVAWKSFQQHLKQFIRWESRPLPKLPGTDCTPWSDNTGESRLLPKMPDEDTHADRQPDCFNETICDGLPTPIADPSIRESHPARPISHDIDQPCLAAVESRAMSDHAMEFHLHELCKPQVGIKHRVCTNVQAFHLAMHEFERTGDSLMLVALLDELHWHPVVFHRHEAVCTVYLESSQLTPDVVSTFPKWTICEMPADITHFCGTRVLNVFRILLGSPAFATLPEGHRILHAAFQAAASDQTMIAATQWGFGPTGQVLKNLATELLKRGIPANVVETRAQEAIKALGSEQVIAALNHRQPWKQLKYLGTNARFQFVMPSELADAVEQNRGKAVGAKGKGEGKSKSKGPPTVVELDPNKLQILDGTFACNGQTMTQLKPNQIGPISSGVVLMSHQDADPYLRSGKIVSREPLALAILVKPGADVVTALPTTSVTVPCKCTVDSEPVLADAMLVQLGQGHVEKVTSNTVVHIESLEVVTLKILVYKDETTISWDEFCQAPIRHLVSLLPKLKRCSEQDCHCDGWHNKEKLEVRDPILDVWRRQFLRNGFRPCAADKADMFSVCIRIPKALLDPLLNASGTAGAYCEPRTADGTEILQDYTVVWTPKHTLRDMLHLMQTNPGVSGLTRLGERRGLRVHSSQAKAIHQLVRPDAVYLPNGPRSVYTVGPMPYGVDRQAVVKILSQAGWECRPLQPSTPSPGRGVMWLVQSTEEPPLSIIPTSHGELVIVKQKPEVAEQAPRPQPVGSASTLALCGAGNSTKTMDINDPWTKADPWGGYKPIQPAPATGPAQGLQQMEDRIQQAVLEKIQPPMEQDDIPDRVHTLESQVQQLLVKQQGLATQLQDFSSQHTQEITTLQGQLNAQSRQLHGHLENQNQTIQSLFEQQMSQIRGLLAKRPRDDGME